MEVTPYHTQDTKKEQVRTMFNSVAHKYDFLNKLLSFGIDKIWRRKTINELKKINPKTVLDIATGTGDVAIAATAAHPDRIVGVDISEGMLEVGRKKITDKNLDKIISLQQGDSEQLQFNDASFDAVTVAFGVRNFQHLEKGLSEMQRVLKPGGKVFVLEFSKPTMFPVKQFYGFYSRYILPFVGKKISGDSSAYTYLPESVKHFPSGKAFGEVLQKCNFNSVVIKPLTFGIVTLYIAVKS